MRHGWTFTAAPVVLLCISLLAGCAGHGTAAVQERGVPLRQPESAYRVVRAGDTLYSIAWESGRDYHELAAWNGIRPPYIIRPGQKLRLHPPSRAKSAPARHSGYHVVVEGDTLFGIADAAGVRYRDLAAWNSLKPPYVIIPGQRLRLTPPEVAPAPAAADDGDGGARGENVAWRWPAEGKLIARFAPNDGNKGIAIAGAAGRPVHAAAAGKVVYQGSGLRGYGQLIIIKHNADFLSAYAHCADIYVQEGSVIKAGQRIATMGSSGTDRVKLYFEIRRRGVPVDPLAHLPKK